MTNLDATVTTPAPTKRRPVRAAILVLVALLIAAATVVGVHMATCEEDTCVIWVCSVQGNRQCGPDTPAVIFP